MIYLLDDDGEPTRELPWRWEICDCCDGHGKTSRAVECDGGGFTASEWAEQDCDFREDYLAGVYDRPCPECRGAGKVKAVDEDRLTDEERAEYEAQADADRAYRAEIAAERRAGC